VGVLGLETEQEKIADLFDLVKAYEFDVYSLDIVVLDDELMTSYQDACQVYAPFLARFIVAEMSNLFFRNNKTLAYATIGRAIFHLYSGSGASSEYYTAPAWQIMRSNDNALLDVFFLNGGAEKKAMGRRKILDRLDGSIFSDNTEYCKNWNILAEAALFGCDAAVVARVADAYPVSIERALDALMDVEKLLKKFPHSVALITVEQIHQARFQILLGLKSPRHDAYKISFDDKRLLENNLLSQLKVLRTTAEVVDFYRQYADIFAIKQHRHYHYMYFRHCLFRRPELPYPNIRIHLVEALQEKFDELISQDAVPVLSDDDMKSLFHEDHFVNGVSVVWRDKVLALSKLLAPQSIVMQK
jgi:hypothetical protein